MANVNLGFTFDLLPFLYLDRVMIQSRVHPSSRSHVSLSVFKRTLARIYQYIYPSPKSRISAWMHVVLQYTSSLFGPSVPLKGNKRPINLALICCTLCHKWRVRARPVVIVFFLLPSPEAMDISTEIANAKLSAGLVKTPKKDWLAKNGDRGTLRASSHLIIRYGYSSACSFFFTFSKWYA